VDVLTLFTAKVDSITQRLNFLNVSMVDTCACDWCGFFNHMTVHCQVGNPFAPSSSEQVAYVNNF